MAEVVYMPKLSDTMTEGVVASWHKKVGDKVDSGDLLAEIETDKATMEFESFQEGVLLHIGVEEGATAPVDSVLAILGEKGEDVSKVLEEEAKKEKQAPKEDAPAAAASEKEEVKPAPDSRPVASQPTKASPAAAPRTAAPAPVESNGKVVASPLARKLAEEKGLPLHKIPGSGEGGRIVKRDVENFMPGGMVNGVESFEEVGLSQMRKAIGRGLAASKFSAPHFYITMDIDMDNAIASRKAIIETKGVKISFNDIVLKAVAKSLKKHPDVNCSFLEDRIRYNKHIHIGVAIAIEDGLLVPVVRFADQKALEDISAEVKDFAVRAKERKLTPDDWAGSTFTVSNLGMFGVEEFTSIINSPDACILAVGGSSRECNEGNFVL